MTADVRPAVVGSGVVGSRGPTGDTIAPRVVVFFRFAIQAYVEVVQVVLRGEVVIVLFEVRHVV